MTCTHLNSLDLSISRILEADFVMARCFAHCNLCHQHYLLELLDIVEKKRMYRVASVAKDAAEATLRSLGQGSCDITRANNEVAAVASLAQREQQLLVMEDGAFVQCRTSAESIPGTPLRQLPLNGSWFKGPG